jgi:hypothetical protein
MPQEQRSYRFVDFHTSINQAAIEVHGRPPRNPNALDGSYAATTGGQFVSVVLSEAINKAKADGGKFWQLDKPITGWRTVAFDENHAAGVFDAMAEMANGDLENREKMRQGLLSSEVLFRAEEILFDVSNSNGK